MILIDTSDLDFVQNESDYQLILNQIKPMIGDINMNNYGILKMQLLQLLER